MSQKTNPISLRLQKSNKHFQSCWYSDFFYNQVLDDDLEFRVYIEGMFYQAARSKTLPSIQSQYKRYCTLLFFLDIRAERHKREYSLKLSREPTEHVLSPRMKFLQGKPNSLVPVRKGPTYKQTIDLLSKVMLSEGEKNNYLIEEARFIDNRRLTHNGTQEYVSSYAVKDLSLNTLLLGGVYQRSCPIREHGPSYSSVINRALERNPPLQEVDLRSPLAGAQSLIENTRLSKPNVSNSGSINLYKKTKSFCSLLALSSALSISYVLKQNLHIPFSVSQQFYDNTTLPARDGERVETALSSADISQNIAYPLSKASRASIRAPLIIQEKERENLFRGFILDHRARSTQNRLSCLFVNTLKKQFIHPKVLPGSKAFPINCINAFTFASLLEEVCSKSKTIYPSQQEWRNKGKGLFHHTELLVNLYTGNLGYHTVHPVRGISPFQSVDFLIESVSYLLQRKISFRQIKDLFFRELEQHTLVKGARLSCAGRLGGRSKKAQKAKTQTAQWGETSLNVFSSRLAFASKGVDTTYGKVGVKLWLCYKS